MSDLEQHLSQQEPKRLPPEWRAEILRAARPPRAEFQATERAWWRNLFWSAPRAWTALGAAWGLMALLQVTMPGTGSPDAKHVAMAQADPAEVRRERQQILAELFPREQPPEPPPPALPPRRRAERLQQVYLA